MNASMKTFVGAAAAAAAMILAGAPAGAATYYVSPTGDNSADGGPDSPWATISHAITTNQVVAGDMIVLRKGTHLYDSSSNKGTYHNLYVSKPLFIVGETDNAEDVVVAPDPGKANTFGAFDVNAAGCVLRNFTVQGAYFKTTGKSGMAFYVRSASTVSNCVVTGTTLDQLNSGSPLYLSTSGAAAWACAITNNASTVGQGFVSIAAGATMYDSLVAGNTTSGTLVSGGVSNCVISGNAAGTALTASGRDLFDTKILNNALTGNAVNQGSYHRCLISSNRCSYAIGSANAYNCLVTSNLVATGFYTSGNVLYYVVNCTFAHNQTTTAKKYMYEGTKFRMYNCLYWDNPYDTGTATGQNNATSNGSTTPLFSNLYAADPQFAPGGWGCALTKNSPCIDVGDASYLTGAFDAAEDYDGNVRVMGNAVDQGCCEFDPSTLVAADCYVATTGSDATGTGAIDAPFATLSNALARTEAYDVIHVGDGTYAQSGELAVAGQRIVGNDANRSAVILTNTAAISRIMALSHAAAQISGLTLTGGRANTGGAVSMSAGTVSNCVFIGNTATNGNIAGGALYMVAGAPMMVTHCLFTNNQASLGHGGAVASNAKNANNVVRFSTFDGNKVVTGNRNGACAYNVYLHDSFLLNGSATREAGGAYNSTLYRCVVTNCSCAFGAALSGDCVAYDSLIARNVSASGDNQNGCSVVNGGTLYNCTVVDNQQNLNRQLRNTSAYNCAIYGNRYTLHSYATRDGGTIQYTACDEALAGTGNILLSASPFANFAGGDYTLGAGSPCINAGSSTAYTLNAMDLVLNPRVALGAVDAGCYEKQALAAGEVALSMEWATTNLVTGASMTFTATATIDAGAAVTFVWTFGDGSTTETSATGTGAPQTVSASHVYTIGGIYDVSVTAYLDDVAVASATVPGKAQVSTASVVPIYVSTTGADTNDGLTAGTAKATIYSAYYAAATGATIYIEPGAYTVTNETPVAKALTIQGHGATREDVVLGGGATSRLFTLNHASAVVRDLTVAGITNSIEGGVAYLTRGTIENCVIKTCKISDQPLIRLGGNNSDAVLSGSLVTNNSASSLYHCGSSWPNPIAKDTDFLYNVGTTYGKVCNGCTLYRCRVVGNTGANPALVYSKLYDCLVANNQSSEANDGRSTTAYNCTFANNYGCTTIGKSNERSYYYNCILWNTTSLDLGKNKDLGQVTCYRCLTNYVKIPTDNETIVSATDDLGLRGDYTVKQSSPAFDGGIAYPVTGGVVDKSSYNTTYFPNAALRTTDLAGGPRIAGENVNIGCFELALFPTLIVLR